MIQYINQLLLLCLLKWHLLDGHLRIFLKIFHLNLHIYSIYLSIEIDCGRVVECVFRSTRTPYMVFTVGNEIFLAGCV